MMVIVANEKCVMPDELAAKTGCWVLLFKRDTVDNADVARPSKSENNRGDEWSSVWFRVQGQFAPQNFFGAFQHATPTPFTPYRACSDSQKTLKYQPLIAETLNPSRRNHKPSLHKYLIHNTNTLADLH